jgi:hypothetical protein
MRKTFTLDKNYFKKYTPSKIFAVPHHFHVGKYFDAAPAVPK